MGKHDKTGRSKSGDKFARLFLCTMQCPAWQALSPYAQRLYPWLLLEFKGSRNNNNGSISLSVRQAAILLGCNRETARRAFHDLQRKGFLIVTRCAALGSVGYARRHLYQITELGTSAEPKPRNRFRDWKPGNDFPVKMAKSNNPGGVGGVGNLESQLTDGASNGRPQLTDGACPNLPDRPNGAKNTHSPTYQIGHPYLPEGGGLRGGGRASRYIGNLRRRVDAFRRCSRRRPYPRRRPHHEGRQTGGTGSMTQWRHGLAKGRSSRVALFPPRSAQRRRPELLALAHFLQAPFPDANQPTENPKPSSKGKNR